MGMANTRTKGKHIQFPIAKTHGIYLEYLLTKLYLGSCVKTFHEKQKLR